MDSSIPISALQHVVFCERQAALIHVERAWAEDGATARGRLVHERVDVPGLDYRRGVEVLRSLRLHSKEHSLHGIADLVERSANGRLFPVEVKSGRKRQRLADIVQLCAQALCLEEMFDQIITEGAVFYARSRRRLTVAFSSALRDQTLSIVRRARVIMQAAQLPPAEYDKRCRRCSLAEHCAPQTQGLDADAYVRSLLA